MIYLMGAIVGAFGSAFLRLLWEHPRDVWFVLVASTFWCLGMKRSQFARETLLEIRDGEWR